MDKIWVGFRFWFRWPWSIICIKGGIIDSSLPWREKGGDQDKIYGHRRRWIFWFFFLSSFDFCHVDRKRRSGGLKIAGADGLTCMAPATPWGGKFGSSTLRPEPPWRRLHVKPLGDRLSRMQVHNTYRAPKHPHTRARSHSEPVHYIVWACARWKIKSRSVGLERHVLKYKRRLTGGLYAPT